MTDDRCIHDLSPASSCLTCRDGPRSAEEIRGRAGPERPAYCKTCSAEVIWVRTENGKNMPLDAEPSDEGRFLKLRVDDDGTKHVRHVRKGELAELQTQNRQLHTSHFATCPDRDLHRRS